MTTQPKALSTRHVLVVDDDAEIVDTIATTLRSRGMEVSTASDGNQGIAFAETKTPDLVILDLMMPRRSGFLVLERLRQNSETQMPIIMITGNEGSMPNYSASMITFRNHSPWIVCYKLFRKYWPQKKNDFSSS